MGFREHWRGGGASHRWKLEPRSNKAEAREDWRNQRESAWANSGSLCLPRFRSAYSQTCTITDQLRAGVGGGWTRKSKEAQILCEASRWEEGSLKMRLGKQVATGEHCSKHTPTFCVLPMAPSGACLCKQGVPATYADPVETVLEN